MGRSLNRYAVIAGLAIVASGGAFAADAYPSRPIRLVVPYTPGGGSDTVARIVSPKVGDDLGGTIVIDNRPGAAGSIGTGIVANAPADGYTLLLADSPFAINSLSKRARYDAQKSFTAVAMLAFTPYVLVVYPSLPATTLKEFIALAKSQPGKLNMGSSGTGGGNHLTGELFKLKAGVDINHVPYKGAGPAISDVMGGQIQSTFASAPGAVPGIKAGRLRPLAVTSAKRSATLPDVPSLSEQGFSDFAVVNWYGITAPAGTPKAAVSRLYDAVAVALAQSDVKSRLGIAALEAVKPAPGQFTQQIDGELVRWRTIIRDAKVQLE